MIAFYNVYFLRVYLRLHDKINTRGKTELIVKYYVY